MVQEKDSRRPIMFFLIFSYGWVIVLSTNRSKGVYL